MQSLLVRHSVRQYPSRHTSGASQSLLRAHCSPTTLRGVGVEQDASTITSVAAGSEYCIGTVSHWGEYHRSIAMRVALLALLLSSCTVPDFRGGVGEQCARNSDCAAPLVCRIGYCRRECRTSDDCFAPAACVEDENGLGACQLDEERRCALQTDCPVPLVCRFGACVNECDPTEGNRDCPAGQRCRETPPGGACVEDVRGGCVHHSDCPGDLVCARDAQCREECRADRDCRTNSYCENVGLCDRETSCLDPDDDGLSACLRACTTDGDCASLPVAVGGAWICSASGGASGACRPACPSGTCSGTGWTCATRSDGARHCEPLIPDPFADAGTPPTMDGGAATDGGIGNDGGADAGAPRCAPSPIRFVDLDAGYYNLFSGQWCGVTDDGRVACWGGNIFGELGRGTTGDVSLRRLDYVMGITDAVEVDVGTEFTCVRLASGPVQCFGVNERGELGDGTGGGAGSESGVPVTVVGLSNAVALDAGRRGICAARSTGPPLCWGSRFADGTPLLVPTLDATFPNPASLIAIGGSNACSVGGGVATCWMDGPMTTVTDIVAAEAGATQVCFIRAGGGVHCFGRNYAGQLGADTGGADSTTGVAVGGLPGPATQLALGTEHSCALLTDGQVWCWGGNRESQLARPRAAVDQSAAALRIDGLGTVTDLAAAGNGTCAIESTGDVVCWGSLYRGGPVVMYETLESPSCTLFGS
jgi:alpha-tubulin suppressor-like RCC1 family protein